MFIVLLILSLLKLEYYKLYNRFHAKMKTDSIFKVHHLIISKLKIKNNICIL